MRLWKTLLVSHLAATALIVGTRPAVSAAREQQPGKATWDRRNFNGIWFLAMDDPNAPSAPEPKPGTPQYWGFDTSPELKGPYLRSYEQRREADVKAGRDFMATCKPMGLPLITVGEYADEILQNANQINWFQEFPGETWRIYLDGRAHLNPAEYPPTLTGNSTGNPRNLVLDSHGVQR